VAAGAALGWASAVEDAAARRREARRPEVRIERWDMPADRATDVPRANLAKHSREGPSRSLGPSGP
jgi:hypothetical protein